MFAIERFNRRYKLIMREPVRRTICFEHEGDTADYRNGDVIAVLGSRRGVLLGAT